MDEERVFSLSYEQLTRFAERRIRECNLDSQGAIYLCESAKAGARRKPVRIDRFHLTHPQPC